MGKWWQAMNVPFGTLVSHKSTSTICYYLLYILLSRFCATPKTPSTWRSSQASPSMAPFPQIWPAVLLVPHVMAWPSGFVSYVGDTPKLLQSWRQWGETHGILRAERHVWIGLERPARWKSLECCCDMRFFSWCLPDWTFAAAFTRPKECVAHSFRHMSISYGSRSRSTLSNTWHKNTVVLDWWGQPKAKNIKTHPIHHPFGVMFSGKSSQIGRYPRNHRNMFASPGLETPACTRRVHHGHNLHTFLEKLGRLKQAKMK